ARRWPAAGGGAGGRLPGVGGAWASGGSGGVPNVPLSLGPSAGRVLTVGLRLLVGGVFAYAAAQKLLDPVAFATDIASYRLLPDGLVGPVAVGLPIIEAVVAASLISGLFARGSALCAGTMLLAFAAAMGQAMLRDIDIQCGCFGTGGAQSQVGLTSIVRNLALLAACLVIMAAPEVRWFRRTSLDAHRRAPDNP